MENIAPKNHNNPPSDMELLQERLKNEHEKPLARAQQLVEAATRAPAEIADDETAGKTADFIKQITACKKTVETVRVAEKEPFLTLGRAVDGFFKRVTDELDVAKNTVQRPLDKYLKQKADDERRRREEAAREERRIAEEKALAAAALEKARQNDAAQDLLAQATASDTEANRLEKLAEVKPAELASSRGSDGAMASLRTRWVGELVDIEDLDLSKLRFHLNPEALQRAINSFVAAGGRELAGANIYEKSEAVVR